MNDFERFSALVERALVNGWRNAIEIDGGADGILIGHEDLGGEWEFTFSVRIDRVWHPAKKRCEPVDMSAPAWEAPEDGLTPQNRALGLALDMLGDVRREIDYAGLS